MKILTFANYYQPGFKGGGPIRTLSSMVEHLGETYSFLVVTRDRDFGDDRPYADISRGEWQSFGKARVRYLGPEELTASSLMAVIRGVRPDVLYLNSLFAPVFTILPLLLRRLRLVRIPVILAPRGELSEGALSIKLWKKRLYLLVAKWLGLYRGVTWQASSAFEEADIRRVFGPGERIHVAPDMALRPAGHHVAEIKSPQASGVLKLVFLSRISRMKNLDGALRMLAQLRDLPVQFSIYGPIEDAAYWEECQVLLSTLPSSVEVAYRGAAEPDQVVDLLRQQHLLLLPTHGENFGHVILEALLGGCPVLISDRTPWRSLQKEGVGWDLPLEEPEAFAAAIRSVALMDESQHRALRERSLEFAVRSVQNSEVFAANQDLFLTVSRS